MNHEPDLDRMFHALADGHRRAMIEQLAAGAAELQASSEAMRAEIDHFTLRAAALAPAVDLAGLPVELMDRISAMLQGRGVTLPPAMARRA